jgi:hypothetical protein
MIKRESYYLYYDYFSWKRFCEQERGGWVVLPVVKVTQKMVKTVKKSLYFDSVLLLQISGGINKFTSFKQFLP